MSKKVYKPATRTPVYVRVSNPTLAPNTGKVSKSRSYLSKLKEKQEQLSRENLTIASQLFKNEELTEKHSIYSENSVCRSDVSFELKPSILAPEDEHILNVIRLQPPKAEICSSSRLNSARNHSPIKNYMVSERCEEVEKDLKLQRLKYRKLETQYNELLNKNAHIETFYSDILENLNKELCESTNGHDQNPQLEGLASDVFEIKSNLTEIQRKFQMIEERIRSKNSF